MKNMKNMDLKELEEINGGGRGTASKIGKGAALIGGTAWRYGKNIGKVIPGPIPPFFIVPNMYNGGPV
ncbi:TPA: hypothetical protein N2D04_003681 [Clostridium botulinum]|nr:hypothetical protein [Clostridium botulinum]HCL4459493.1 hypothetical protein [Clostridium botulinum]HCL4463198.1 hypothetical protein [Clostridium botulinum]HCL4474170.1 hypothetical protein [Clostridium botulinum]HCL4477846.1 hypothetical protein [Clostridium botulinum]